MSCWLKSVVSISPDYASGLEDERGRGLFARMACGSCAIVKMNMTLSSMMPQIHLDTRKGCLPRNFTVMPIRALKEDGIMVYQHGSPFL